MPHRQQQIIQARAILLRAFIDIFRIHYRSFFGTEQFGANIELGFVLFAIVVGQSENKPMTATDIASYLGMDRATVSRKIAQIAKIKALRTARDGRRICYSISDIDTPAMLASIEAVARLIKRENRQLFKLIDIGVDHK